MAMCPKCGIKIYLNSKTRYECPVHGEFKLNYWNGELESIEKKNSKQDLPFNRTFKDGKSFARFNQVLDENSAKVEQMLRGNHGGGCPSPFKEEL
jgi:hypothetical protein